MTRPFRFLQCGLQSPHSLLHWELGNEPLGVGAGLSQCFSKSSSSSSGSESSPSPPPMVFSVPQVKKLRAFRGSLTRLTEADLFMVMLVQVPSYKERLQCMVIKEEFTPHVENLKYTICTMTFAARGWLCGQCRGVPDGIASQTGGHKSKQTRDEPDALRCDDICKVAPMRLCSLLIKPRLHLQSCSNALVQFADQASTEAEKKDVSLLDFSNQLQHIGPASRFLKQEVEADFQKEVKRVADMQLIVERHEELQEQMASFIQEAQKQLTEVNSSLQALNSVSHSLAEYFCEDPEQFKLEECCSIFHSFCEKFLQATQLNIII
ncbi:UNVERIFIED_CONTAM: hypothetical protein FKN15_075191 [Acipenser sinensis]